VWFLQAFRALGGGADYARLPQLQTLLIALALLALAWQLALLLRAPWVAAIVVPVIWTHRGVWEAMRFVTSEGLFLPLLLAVLALAIAHARSGSGWSLAGAAFCCALAAITRSIGAILLLLPVLLVLLAWPIGLRPMLRRLAIVVLAAALPLLAGMAWHKAQHGFFGLGSYAGVSLLGKALLLLRPALANDAVLAQVSPLAEQARAAVAAAPDYAASLRAQAQAYEELRWRAFYPAAAASWPAWRDADLGGESRLAGPVALRIIAAEPRGYVALALRDWSGLVLYPHFWPTAWQAENTPHPFFARCAEPRRCWVFERLQAPRWHGLVMLITSLGGLLATVVVLLRSGTRALRGRLTSAERLTLAVAVVTQATLAATALFEAGLWRYGVAPHVMHALLLAWAGTSASRAPESPPARNE
jgi:hypothetical protein